MPRFCALILCCLAFAWVKSGFAEALIYSSANIFTKQSFSEHESVLVSTIDGKLLYDWRADKALIPASLMKLVLAHLAIKKWGLEHRFETGFYLDGSELWVKGYGDPFLISEELDLIANELRELLPQDLSAINIDNRYFANQTVPGRSSVSDPYNAPLSAVSANFNTAMLKQVEGSLVSAEPQTPLTATAVRLGKQAKIGAKAGRVNLQNTENAQQHFAELLLAKLDQNGVEIKINQSLPTSAKMLYRHKNSHSLAKMLRGTLEYSNNFIANQLFLMLGENANEQMQFSISSAIAQKETSENLGWHSHIIADGSGLSRQSRLSATQINQLLVKLAPHKQLFKQYPIDGYKKAVVHAKSGTLNGVHNLAGYIDLPSQQYTFVFMFNQAKPYRYREQLLAKLVAQLERLPSR